MLSVWFSVEIVWWGVRIGVGVEAGGGWNHEVRFELWFGLWSSWSKV